MKVLTVSIRRKYNCTFPPKASLLCLTHTPEPRLPRSEKYMVLIPMVTAVFVAVLTTAFLALIYIPSTTTTILKLRSGYIPTLRNKHFCWYRRAPDQVTLLTGMIFWGTLVSGVVVGGIVGLVLFFFLWQGTAFYAQVSDMLACVD